MVSIIFKGVLEPKGGPSGYLYNLGESLKLNKINDIQIISIKFDEQKKESFFKKTKFLLKNKIKLPHSIQEKRKLNFYRRLLNNNIETIQSSEILHFHTTQDLYYFSKIYDLSKHSILLMSHSPEPSNIEVYNSFISQGYRENEARLKQKEQEKADIFAFKNANYLIFPCEGATSPYKDFFRVHNIDTSKLKYVITSSKPLISKIAVDEFKVKHSIAKDKKIISYVGRKNKIKGFDIFCEIAKKLKDDDIFFFISAGTGDIDAIVQDNFLDLGWTDDPASLINASDVQIVPNRDTYFDLGIIQALSLNTKLITTLTGGNSWFKDKELEIFFADYQDIDSFINFLKKEEIFKANTKNIDFYKKFLNNDIFALNYQELYKNL